ncbi:hypothetical protein ONZ45_g5464 [Pleurotus djamor]|nr:hypothetical protein ONZ45_g5464 [Pleurotus djamor]
MATLLYEAQNLDTNIFSAPKKTSALSSQAYVLALASTPVSYAAAASAPSNRIDIYDKSSLQGIQTLSGHEVAITSLFSTDALIGSNGPVYVSSGRDGLVNVWDQRSGTTSIQMSTYDGGNKPLLCCDVSPGGEMVAAGTDLQGTDALILYWDPRKPTIPIRTHTEVHSDDITTLRFSQEGGLLLSASSDGLLSIINPEEDDEDECVLHVGNFGCSVAQADWIYSPEGSRVWAASDMETFSVWSQEVAILPFLTWYRPRLTALQMDQLQNLDIRGPSVHSQKRTWVTDYLITCHSDSQGSSNLSVYTGSNEYSIFHLVTS